MALPTDATVAEKRRERFNMLFHSVLGNQTGTTRENYGNDTYVGPTMGATLLKSSTPKSSGPSYDQIVSDRIKADMIAKLANHSEDNGIWGNIKDGIFRGLDIVSRPSYAVMEGLRNVQESINDGEPFWSLGDDLIYGMGQGLAGFKKTGYGQVVEEATKYDRTGKGWANRLAAGSIPGLNNPTGGEVLAQMEQTNPDAAKWAKRGMGLLGDIALDPTTYISFGTAKAAKESLVGGKLITKAAEDVGKDAVMTTIENVVKRAVHDAPGANVVRVRTINPTTKMFGKSLSVADKTVDDVLKQADKLIYEVAGGAQKGKMIFGKEVSRTVAQSAAEGFRLNRLVPVENKISKFVESVKKGIGLSKDTLKRYRGDEYFEAFYKKYIDNVVAVGEDKALAMGREAASTLMQKDIDEIFQRVLNGVKDEFLTVPTIRVMGKNIASMPSLGKLGQKVGNKLSNRFEGALKAFNWTSNFPGYSSLISQKARALGIKEFERFRKQVIELAQGTTKADRIAIQKALESGTKLPGQLGEKLKAVKQLYKDIFAQEIASGARASGRNRLDDYAYTFLRGSEKERNQFLKERRLAIERGESIANYGSDAAKARGLKPVEDAFENLLYRKVGSNRKLTRQFFFQDLISHYGIKGTIDHAEATRRGLIQVGKDYFPDNMAKTLKPGEKIFIDRDIQEIMSYYAKLSTPNSAEAQSLVRALDYVTRKFKVWNTIYYPGFHIRNFISDMYMGALDGVSTRDYSRIMKSWFKRSDPSTMLDVGGETVRFSSLIDAFEENAASGGFFNAELPETIGRISGKGKASMLDPRGFPTNIRKFSEHREDFGRFAHFYHAMTEEYPAAIKRYGKTAKAWDAAVNTSVFRVNKYKFDYGALTRVEQQFMRRGIPFYTYSRKAIPTLIESMFLSPKYLSYTNKFFDSLAPNTTEDFNAMLLPDWMREMGFAQITGGKEPTGLSGNFLPQAVLGDIIDNPAAMTHPLLRSIFELQSGKDTYSGRPVNGVTDLIRNNIRAFGTYRKLDDPNVTGIEKLGNITGLPFYSVTQNRQDQALQDVVYGIKDNLRKYNDALEMRGMRIYLSQRGDGVSIRIKTYDPENPNAGRVIKEFTTWEQVQQFLSGIGM